MRCHFELTARCVNRVSNDSLTATATAARTLPSVAEFVCTFRRFEIVAANRADNNKCEAEAEAKTHTQEMR